VQADEILPKINALKQYYIHKQEIDYKHVNCNVAVMWRIPPPNRSLSSEVSEVFPLCEIEDIFDNAKGPEYDV